MSVNNKRVFYVKYLAHDIYTEIMKSRPARSTTRTVKPSET